MLRSIKGLIGYNVLAKDGKIGHVEDFYFNDEHWIIRYLIVDIGIWIFGRKVLISPDFFIKEPDWINNTFPINLTKDQVKNSPDISTDKPVSRQKEDEIAKYYSLPVYWSAGNPAIFPYAIPIETSERDVKDSKKEEEKEEGDSHLRSTNELKGYNIKAEDGEVGHVEDFIVDDISWKIKYIVVDIKKVFHGKKVIIDLNWIKDVSWANTRIHVDHKIEEIKNSPDYDPAEPVNRKYEEILYDYYGRPRYWE